MSTTPAPDVDHTRPGYGPDPDGGNLLDANTSSFEGGFGQWGTWFNATIARGTDSAVVGTTNLSITITTDGTWGVQTGAPGFETDAGSHWTRCWVRTPMATDVSVKLQVVWADSNSNTIREDELPSPILSSAWLPLEQVLQAPPGTAVVWPVLTGVGKAQEVVELDDVFIQE
jgi:hypothetical protein